MNNNENKKSQNGIRKPRLIVNDLAKFYIASQEIQNENDNDLFFIMSLFLPVEKGTIYFQPHTEMVSFDDAESAHVYSETLSQYSAINAKTKIGQQCKEIIADFYKHTK